MDIKTTRNWGDKGLDDILREGLTESLVNILLGERIPVDIISSETRELVCPANRKMTYTLLRRLASFYKTIEIDLPHYELSIEKKIKDLHYIKNTETLSPNSIADLYHISKKMKKKNLLKGRWI